MGKFSGAVLHVRKFRGAIITDESKVPTFPATPDFPVTPDESVTASLYLYGTPSTTGNIGLRVGESVTYYDGIAAQNIDEVWTDKAKYPCALICKPHSASNSIYLMLCSVIDYHTVGTGTYTTGSYMYYELIDGEWVYEYAYDTDRTQLSPYKVLYWSNVDIYNKDGTEKVLAKSDPIPVSGLVGNSYNGTVLPVLPAEILACQHIVILAYIPTQYISNLYWVFASNDPMTVGDTKYGDALYYGTHYSTRTKANDPSEWGTPSESDVSSNFVLDGYKLMWSNYDIKKGDSVYFAKSADPLPVYE